MGLFIFGYGISRFIVELFREADPQFIMLNNPNGYIFSFGNFGLSMGQLLSLPMILVGLLFVMSATLRKDRSSA